MSTSAHVKLYNILVLVQLFYCVRCVGQYHASIIMLCSIAVLPCGGHEIANSPEWSSMVHVHLCVVAWQPKFLLAITVSGGMSVDHKVQYDLVMKGSHGPMLIARPERKVLSSINHASHIQSLPTITCTCTYHSIQQYCLALLFCFLFPWVKFYHGYTEGGVPWDFLLHVQEPPPPKLCNIKCNVRVLCPTPTASPLPPQQRHRSLLHVLRMCLRNNSCTSL